MGSTASDYNMSKLLAGQVIALLSIFLAVFTPDPVFRQSYLFVLIVLLYSAMMFASSYVEEEHNFWYWAASGWIASLVFKT